MRIVLFIFGLWFAYWNYCGMCENPAAILHFVALTGAAIILGIAAFHWFFDFLTMPNYSATMDVERL